MEKSIYLDLIAKQKDQYPVIYIAVGSAAHRIDQDNDQEDRWILPESNNQEYPLFLQILKSEHPGVTLHIFLIDPALEDLPFVITIGDKKTLKDGWLQINNEMFYNQAEKTTIYAIKDYMVYPYREFDQNKEKYTIFFEKLNHYSKQLNWTTFFVDFSGALFRECANYYSKYIVHHLDHIIYGFFADDAIDSSCLIDTTAPQCLFICYEENNMIKVFNPYAFDKNYHLEFPNILQKINSDKKIIALVHIKNFLREKRKYIKNIFSTMRNIQVGLNKKEIINEYHQKNLQELSEKYNFNYPQEFDEQAYIEIKKLLEKEWSEEMRKYIFMLYDNDSETVIKQKYENMMKEDNPYHWDKHTNDLYINYDDFF